MSSIASWKTHGKKMLPVVPNEKETILLIAGDLLVLNNFSNTNKLSDFLFSIKDRFKAVVYVAGNHEFYYSNLETVRHQLATTCRRRGIHFLDNNVVEFDGVRVLGTTLWTALTPLEEPMTQMMNDTHLIAGFNSTVWIAEHQKAVNFLTAMLQKDYNGKTVVVTHHGPSYKSMASQYVNDKVNCCYYSNLDGLMWEYPISLWVHGHTHVSFDYMIGDEQQSARVVCNPCGYLDEKNRNYKVVVIEV
jgi:2',3'-cyclic-nucleotide 2'-phosphodiesterase (5'-nucleotidase family)